MLLSSQHPYPEYYTPEREEYDLRELEALGSLAIKLNVHSFPGMKRTFEDLLLLVGTKNFVYKYAKVYQLLLNLWNTNTFGGQKSTPFDFWSLHENDQIDSRLLAQLLVQEEHVPQQTIEEASAVTRSNTSGNRMLSSATSPLTSGLIGCAASCLHKFTPTKVRTDAETRSSPVVLLHAAAKTEAKTCNWKKRSEEATQHGKRRLDAVLVPLLPSEPRAGSCLALQHVALSPTPRIKVLHGSGLVS